MEELNDIISEQPMETSEKRRANILGYIVCVSIIALCVSGVYFFVKGGVDSAQEMWLGMESQKTIKYKDTDEKTVKAYKKAELSVGALDDQLQKFKPVQPYMVINTIENHFKLYADGNKVREGFCSTGSNVLLKSSNSDKSWVFKTPKGIRTVKAKSKAPVWKKPDWAFVEDGQPIPPPNSPLRYEENVLGDYKLELGDGYMVHGTLYKRFLGLAVTHGCVRLNDDDLEAVFMNLVVGSKVFIY